MVDELNTGTTATATAQTSSAPTPTSPSAVKHDNHLTEQAEEPLSPDVNPSLSPRPQVSRLPNPRTPASLRSRDTRSDYYTAAWGSPYEFSPSQLSRSAHTAVSEQPLSEDFHELSPSPSFGLEHLVPSRLSDLSLPQAELSALGIQIQDAGDPVNTPRSRTQRWVQLPQREEQPERVHWWSDESVRSRSESGGRPRASSSTSSVHGPASRGAHLGHKSRADNRTLDQQSFWNTLRERRPDNMAGLMDSRWAATPPPTVDRAHGLVLEEQKGNGALASGWTDEPETKSQQPDANLTQSTRQSSGMFASRWADTPESEDVQEPKGAEEAVVPTFAASPVPEQDQPSQALPIPDQQSRLEQGHTIEQSTRDVANQQQSSINQPVSATRLEPPRLKRKVSWRGKNIVISIPRLEFGASGLAVPLSEAEVQERVRAFANAGFDTNGYDLSHDRDRNDGPAQAKGIFPDETEARILPSKNHIKVLLPDLERWRAYTDWLTEQKLAALGVTLGFDDPAPAIPTQDVSRQSSAQYPPLPFSPPIPTTSGGSKGRPGMMRGHSHTMSVAAPISPVNGPFGHMHRHSTFAGPMGLPQLHTVQQHSPGIPGLQPFSPQQQFALSGMPRGGSPAQISAIRQDLGSVRGPSSPLSHQLLTQSPQEYSRGLIEDQRRRQHAYSQSMQQPIMPHAFVSQPSSLRPTPALPELPEDEDEEALDEPEPPAYVPPHKRVQANTEIAVPTPRGHRHNISEGLERELLEAEQRQKVESRDWIEVTEEDDEPQALPAAKTNGVHRELPRPTAEKDPLGSEHIVQESTHSHKKSASRFNVTAPSFTFNPGANFQPGASFQPAASFQSAAAFQPPQSTFSFGAPAFKTNPQATQSHRRDQSSGSFNANAPAFRPVTSEFSFSSAVPSSTLGNNMGSVSESEPDHHNIVDELPSIFGKVQIPDIVRPARRSKAVAIVRPQEPQSSSESDYEDDEGRVAQGEAKRKQMRKPHDDGDNEPLFAEPTPAPDMTVPADKVLGSNVTSSAATDDRLGEGDRALDSITEQAEHAAEESTTLTNGSGTAMGTHVHKHSTSLSALAKPFKPPSVTAGEQKLESRHSQHEHISSISDLEEGEIWEHDTPAASSVKLSESSTIVSQDFAGTTVRPGLLPFEYPSNERIGQVEQAEPSFDEIDAVMRQLNAEESELEPAQQAEEVVLDMRPQNNVSPTRLPSPGSHPMKGVTYLAEWSRSDAPSPSPRRQQQADSNGVSTGSGDQGYNGWPAVRQLNKAEEVATSDWSGVLSPPEEDKLQQRSNFFDSHIDNIIGRVVEQRLQPLEDSLRSIQNTVARRNRSSDLKLHRTPSNVESDADDEDEISDENKQRPISRGRDKRVDQIKAIVIEALREQSPMRFQASVDLAELHSVLADMKVSFARAASASLELDDIRAVVEDSLNRQSQAIVPITIDDGKEHHRRELSELEGRLNETLAGALEEANQRRAIEEREADVRRQLRLAEEELQILRDTAHDDASRARAMEQEREDLLNRLDRAESACRDIEDKLEDSQAEKDALQATLDEYRASSNKWRHDIDDGKRVREELESTIASMDRQNEDYQESTLGMKRRLERLHADTATAAGQLASEKATWKSKEADYRAKIEALEAQNMVSDRARAQLEDELRVVRANAVDAADSRYTLDHLRATNVSLDEMVRKLQADLTEQQSLAARFERQFYDAQESSRAEVHRTRMSLESEVEAAKHHVGLVRAQLETELTRTRTELENVRMEAETAKERHGHLIEEEETARREALRKVNHANSVALDEARHKYESAIQELTAQQTRALTHAIEDKNRAESFLGEKLSLADAKNHHLQERVLHLEERLDVARSAAQAAAQSAKASRVQSPPTLSARMPEKVSPQALRESILVLQDQLQERESRIERLEAQYQEDGVVKVKERDTEINWLRELLAVRSEELTELVNTLSKPDFDRAAVRDTAIRISANLQMEQQEKERSGKSAFDQSLGVQALSSISSIATPKLTSAFNKWRQSMENSSLKDRQRVERPHPSGRAYTPSKPRPQSSSKDYTLGLMTPPASNLRSSPMAVDSLSEQRPRTGSNTSATNAFDMPGARSRHASATPDLPSTPLFHEQSYDHDAADGTPRMQHFEDDDLEDVADTQPPAFRSLEAEMKSATVEGAAQEIEP